MPAGACIEGRAAAVLPPDSRNCMMSLLVTLPEMPVPGTPVISTPCSAAIFRTSGEDFVRKRSSRDAPLPPTAALCSRPVARDSSMACPLGALEAAAGCFGGGDDDVADAPAVAGSGLGV